MKYSRRDLSLLATVLLAASKARAAEDNRIPTTVINRNEVDTVKSNQVLHKQFFGGTTHENVPVRVMETELAAGEGPHPPHKHVHEEMALVREGALDVFIEGRGTKRLTAGGLVYVASNQLHGWKNPGTTPARYFVVAIGND
jgi:quercetin dioxygenase-like cupin family protein